jgi:crossover junction endodeoxyribonuclease RusA
VGVSLEITLPWPPSTNTYWRHPSKGALAGRHLISDKGRRYRAQVKWEAMDAPHISGRVSVAILASPPDRRRRDLDNILKSLLDSIVHAGVIEDDSLIDALFIVRDEVVEGGKVHVRITSLEEA